MTGNDSSLSSLPPFSYGTLLNAAQQRLALSSPSPRLDAELLAEHLWKIPRSTLIAFSERVVTAEAAAEFEALVERRAAGEPVAYLMGYKEFFGRRFLVSPAVLVPRPETELLVERAVAAVSPGTATVRVLDLGTGSGCIAISLVAGLRARFPGRGIQMVAVDESADALAVAAQNARALGVADAIQFLHSNWYSAIPPQQFDLILSNPPYVRPDAAGLARDLSFEPQGALFADNAGMQDIQTIVAGLRSYLKAGGIFLCEIGADQEQSALREVQGLLEGQARVIKDLAGLPRILELLRAK